LIAIRRKFEFWSEKLQGSALVDWLPQMEGDNYELSQQLRAGKIFGAAPFDDLFVLGMDRDDTDLWMRGLIATRDGRKGSSPVGMDICFRTAASTRGFTAMDSSAFTPVHCLILAK
jgi:hypothetical protein